MAGVSVDHLALALTLPQGLADRAGPLRSAAADVFVPRVLSMLADRLGERFGADAVVTVRKLRLTTRLRPVDLRDGGRAERLASEIAAQIAAQARRPRKGRAEQALREDVQVYRGPLEYAAVRLIAAAGRHKTAAGRRETVAALWTDPAAIPASRRLAILIEAERLQGLAPVLAELPEASLAELLQEAKDWPQVPASLLSALQAAISERRIRPNLTDGSTSDPAASPPGNNGASPASDGSRSPDQADRQARAGSPAAPSIDPEAPPLHPGINGTPPGPDINAGLADAMPVDPAKHHGQGAAEPATQASGGAAKPAPDLPGDAGRSDPGVLLSSEWCGLFYLVNISLRLGLPERLWHVGIDEGAALAGMLGQLGDPGDPAALVLAADFPHPPDPQPSVPDWAWAELESGLLPAPVWGDAMTRVPAIEAAFCDDAPRSLAAWGAAVHLAACEHLLGRHLPRAEVEALLRRPGQIVLTEGAITLTQPLEAIDIEVRRAGLDTDPGWLPWLSRTLTFRFTGGEDAA